MHIKYQLARKFVCNIIHKCEYISDCYWVSAECCILFGGPNELVTICTIATNLLMWVLLQPSYVVC